MKSMQFTADMAQAVFEGRKTQTRRLLKPQPSPPLGTTAKPCYAVGDLVCVKEPYQLHTSTMFMSGKHPVAYKGSDAKGRGPYGDKWMSAKSMPQKYSRSLIHITGVRLERLQEITEDDARAEGIIDGGCLNCGESEPCGCASPMPDARDGFIYLWDSIYADKPAFRWAANPWVYVYEFEVLRLYRNGRVEI